jgi:putative ABC transport system substrate-binding protein
LFLVGSGNLLAQEYDLAAQLRIIKDLIPNSTRLGVLYNPGRPNIDALISNASQDTGLVVVKSPVENTRDMTNAVRSLSKYDVDFIFMIEDKTVTGVGAIKFVVKQTMRKKIPVFTISANAFKGGAYGWIVENGSSWRIKINGSVQERFDITVPDNSALFTIEE